MKKRHFNDAMKREEIYREDLMVVRKDERRKGIKDTRNNRRKLRKIKD